MSKKLIHLLRHGSLPRDNDGAIEFWRIKDYLQDHFVFCHHWSDEKWNSSMAGGGGHKKRFQYCADSSGTILYLRALQGHSGRNLIDPSLQDNVVIPDGFFKYIITSDVQSIYIPSSIQDWYREVKIWATDRQYSFCLWIPWTKTHKDPDTIDLGAPRLAQYMHKAWKKHQNTVYWVDNKLAQKKGLKFYQTRSNAIILHEALPAYCIPKVVRMETGGYTNKVYASPRPPPKISLKHDWMKELGSEVARQPEGEVARQAEGSQPTQPNPNPIMIERWDPLFAENTSRSSNQEIETRFSRKLYEHQFFKANHDGTERPAVCREPVGSPSTFNEVDIDFRISGMPRPVVKQAENSRVRELVKKIENHPHRQDLQADLQQNNAYNPFSEKSKKMIKDMGNGELFELCETNPKVQCKECLLYWNQGIVYCTCGHLLKESEASRSVLQWTLDLLSIQNYVIKNGRLHGHR